MVAYGTNSAHQSVGFDGFRCDSWIVIAFVPAQNMPVLGGDPQVTQNHNQIKDHPFSISALEQLKISNRHYKSLKIKPLKRNFSIRKICNFGLLKASKARKRLFNGPGYLQFYV